METVTVVNAAEETDGHGELKMRFNLVNAMRHLRLPDQSRTLWIDAVCINQNDSDDKSAQVKRIGQITRSPQRSLCGLAMKKTTLCVVSRLYRLLGTSSGTQSVIFVSVARRPHI
jgi:hypothetical protein